MSAAVSLPAGESAAAMLSGATTLLAELAAYDQPLYTLPERLSFPLQDEPHIAAWAGYVAQAARVGAWSVLRQCLIQLQFPIAEKISQQPEYQAATRRGIERTGGPGLQLAQPEKLEIFLYPGIAGQIPVIFTPVKADFQQLVRAIRHKNEPVALPDSIGAMFISGYNNWDRIRSYRQKWAGGLPDSPSEAEWAVEFSRLTGQPELYQDSFILMSRGNYSNLSAQDLNVAAAAWQQHSLSIRLLHEYTHYLTRRVFGHLRTHAVDELLADYAGLVGTYGHFKLDYFLQFMGLEAYPHLRENGRLAYYRKQLSEFAFAKLQALLLSAAERLTSLETTPQTHPFGLETAVTVLAAISLPLHLLAGPDGDELLTKARQQVFTLLGGKDEQSYLSQIGAGTNFFARTA
jgi:hypothetical protein